MRARAANLGCCPWRFKREGHMGGELGFYLISSGLLGPIEGLVGCLNHMVGSH